MPTFLEENTPWGKAAFADNAEPADPVPAPPAPPPLPPPSHVAMNNPISSNTVGSHTAESKSHPPSSREERKSRRQPYRRCVVSCLSCRRAKAKCEDIRPCPRCVRLGRQATCRDGEISSARHRRRAPRLRQYQTPPTTPEVAQAVVMTTRAIPAQTVLSQNPSVSTSAGMMFEDDEFTYVRVPRHLLPQAQALLSQLATTAPSSTQPTSMRDTFVVQPVSQGPVSSARMVQAHSYQASAPAPLPFNSMMPPAPQQAVYGVQSSRSFGSPAPVYDLSSGQQVAQVQRPTYHGR